MADLVDDHDDIPIWVPELLAAVICRECHLAALLGRSICRILKLIRRLNQGRVCSTLIEQGTEFVHTRLGDASFVWTDLDHGGDVVVDWRQGGAYHGTLPGWGAYRFRWPLLQD